MKAFQSNNDVIYVSEDIVQEKKKEWIVRLVASTSAVFDTASEELFRYVREASEIRHQRIHKLTLLARCLKFKKDWVLRDGNEVRALDALIAELDGKADVIVLLIYDIEARKTASTYEPLQLSIRTHDSLLAFGDQTPERNLVWSVYDPYTNDLVTPYTADWHLRRLSIVKDACAKARA